MARASALRVNLNLQPSAPSLPRPSARTKHAHLLYALNLSHRAKAKGIRRRRGKLRKAEAVLLLTFLILGLSQASPTRKAESGVQGVRQHWRPPSLMAPDSCYEACRGNYLDNQSGATAHPLQQIELFRCRCGSCLQLLRNDAPPDGRILMSKALQHNELVRQPCRRGGNTTHAPTCVPVLRAVAAGMTTGLRVGAGLPS